MGFHFEELDAVTRQHMLIQFDDEWGRPDPYIGKNLSPVGRDAFPELMRQELDVGDDDSLVGALLVAEFWNTHESWVKDGIVRGRKVNIGQAAERLGRSEYNTWYVRGLCARLIDERIEECRVYRGMEPRWQVGDCSEHEDDVYPVQLIFDGHRRRYWPEPGDDTVLAIPLTAGCHHTIRRYP